MTEAIGSAPLWLIAGYCGVQFFVQLKTWIKNGGVSASLTDGEFKGHCSVMEQMFKEDPPRRHTELLTQVVSELKAIRKDLAADRER